MLKNKSIVVSVYVSVNVKPTALPHNQEDTSMLARPTDFAIIHNGGVYVKWQRDVDTSPPILWEYPVCRGRGVRADSLPTYA